MNNKTRLGAIRKNVQGFDIREILTPQGKSSGKIGLYTGKKMIPGTEQKANLKGMEKLEAIATTNAETRGRATKEADKTFHEEVVRDKAAAYNAHMANIKAPQTKKKRGGKR